MTIAADNAATLLIESADRLVVHRLTSEATIGRDRRCQVVIDHPTVSRSHARIFVDTRGWHLQDLGSQNGSRLGDSRTAGESVLGEACELRIGRVRAWFFAGPVPAGWAPPDAPRLAGKLIRCVCGHIGWAPVKTGDGQLRCTACGRDILRRDPNHDTVPPAPGFPAATPVAPAPIAPAPAAAATADCAACHTPIAAGEPMHACSDCGATMHSDCWTENRGCATYGCPQVGVLDRSEGSGDSNHLSAAKSNDAQPATGEQAPITASLDAAAWEASKQSLMAVIAFALGGVPLFGVPPIGYAAYRLLAADTSGEGRRRFVWAAISFVAGVVGFACSAAWWLGVRLHRL